MGLALPPSSPYGRVEVPRSGRVVIKQHLVLIISVMAVIAALYHPFASSQIDNGNQQVQDEKRLQMLVIRTPTPMVIR